MTIVLFFLDQILGSLSSLCKLEVLWRYLRDLQWGEAVYWKPVYFRPVADTIATRVYAGSIDHDDILATTNRRLASPKFARNSC